MQRGRVFLFWGVVTAADSAAADSRKLIEDRIPLSGGTNSEEATNSNANRSSGKRGLGERGFSQRSRLSPQKLPIHIVFWEEREGGDFSTEKLSSLALPLR